MTRLGYALGALMMAASAVHAQAYHLVWSDEFNGPANTVPAASDWNIHQGWGPGSNHEIQWYCLPHSDQGPCSAADPNLYEDGDGYLVLKAIHNGRRWSSARLDTAGKHALQYGRVEARLRMEPGAGFWPAFWMLGDDLPTVGWPACGELDIMEWVTRDGPGTTSATVHGPGYNEPGGIGKKYAFPVTDGTPGRIDDGEFHTYGMTWSKDRVEFYRDDPEKPFFVVTPASLPAGRRWVFDHPFYVILNFAVAEAGFAAAVDDSTPKTGRMWVDYVRFYQR